MLPEYEERIDCAELPVKTKEQLKNYLTGKDISAENFDSILARVLTEYQNTRKIGRASCRERV